MSALVFLDFETTGLTTADEPWEFAAVRREPDSSEREWWTFIDHDERKAEQLPESFLADYRNRYDFEQSEPSGRFPKWLMATGLLEGRPHVVGAVPDFDARHLRKMLGTNGYTDPWHYHLIDVETLVVGYLRACADRDGLRNLPQDALSLPWDSDELSRAIGVEPPGPGVRHTAMGDVRWTMALWDAVMGGAR